MIPHHHLTRLLAGALVLAASWSGVSHAATVAPPGGPHRADLTNVQVTNDTYKAHSEPAVTIDPTDPNIMVAGSKDFTSPQNYAFKIGWENSTDGGKTWTDHGWLPGWDKVGMVSDISFAFDRHHDVYASVLLVGANHYQGVGVNVSHDGGQTFAPGSPVWYTTPNSSDKGWIAVDNSGGTYDGHAFMVWDFGGARHVPYGLLMSRTSDGGQTWTKPAYIEGYNKTLCGGHKDGHCNSVFSPYPAVGPDGVWHVVFKNDDSTVCNNTILICNLLMVSSSDGGATWSNPVLVAQERGVPQHFHNVTPAVNYRNSIIPMLAISPKTGTMFVAWNEEREHGAVCPVKNFGYAKDCDVDVLLVRSTDSGQTWSSPVRLNDDSATSGANQFQPAMAVSPDGTVGVSWFDTRNDPHNFLIDTYCTVSKDDGVTWAPNIRASTVSWNPTIDAPHDGNGDTFIGDYQGVAMDDTSIHPLWNDTRNGKTQELYTAAIAY